MRPGATHTMRSETSEPIERLRTFVGESALVEAPRPARVPMRMGAGIAFEPRLIAQPTTTHQVQEIVAWANETRTPLVPISSGGPHLHGGSVPSVPGTVQVDLAGMTRIPRIDRRQRLVLIEPGVTFGQLVPALREAGLRIALPLLPRRHKSVLASLLEREPTLVPRWHWNMMEPLRSLEIVWGNGDRLVSGSQTTTDKDEDWDTGVIPMVGGGPAQVDFFRLMSGAQGSMGIATWASVKVEPISDQQKLLFIPAAELGDLIDCAYRLLRVRFGDETFLANAVTLALILAGEPSERARLAAELPRWCLVVGIGGGSILGAEKVAARRSRHSRHRPGATGCGSRTHCRAARARACSSCCRTRPANPTGARTPGGRLERPLLHDAAGPDPRLRRDDAAVSAELGYPSDGIGVYIQPVHMGADTHCEFVLPFDAADAVQARRVGELFDEGSRALFRAGAYFSRPYGMWAPLVFNADAETDGRDAEGQGDLRSQQRHEPRQALLLACTT